MYPLRRRQRSRKTRKALSAFRRRKAFGLRRRARRVRRPAGLMRFRKYRSTSRRRSVSRRGGRGLRRPIGRRRRLLKASRDGPINTRYSYRVPSRRPSRINTRLRKQVALATNKQYRLTGVTNAYASTALGRCVWGQLTVGDAADISHFSKHLRNNYDGYLQVDPNTTTGAPNQSKMKFHIDQMRRHAMFFNNCTAKIHVEVYELIPRHDIHGSLDSTWSPYALVTNQEQSGDLVDTQFVDGIANAAIGWDDPRFTPYMVPTLTMTYKILNKRKFTVHAGARWDLNVSMNNFDATYFNDWEDTSLSAKKGKYKVVLFKAYGELGVAQNADASVIGIRHLPIRFASKTDYVAKGRVADDGRVIYSDELITANETLGFVQGAFIEQENLIPAAVQSQIPTTTG